MRSRSLRWNASSFATDRKTEKLGNNETNLFFLGAIPLSCDRIKFAIAFLQKNNLGCEMARPKLLKW
ncbi:hypothetical protein [Xenococcus sp. PCC 7305]|uniref:hypothetical protein n=1 Tax=Xenococcus sp. PCC 7305 TaxID=102125 RepID=UPI0002DBFAB0|nr:hypothetical protein [Xenococcus sp. PCC 7305]